MIELDYQLINDDRMLASLSAADRYAASALEKLRTYELNKRIGEFFQERRKVIILNTVKDEARYIVEWVAYHRLIGVDGIVLLDNDSKDATPDILSALHRAGIVCAIPWPTVHPYEKQQISAFANAVRALQAVRASEWLGFLDVDEFYVSRDHRTLDAALAAMSPADCYHLTWQFFGSSGAKTREAGLVIERFANRAPFGSPHNWQGKPLMKLDEVVGHFHHPHNVKLGNDAAYKLPDGTTFPGALPQRDAPIAPTLSEAKRRSASILALHHYAVRSREEFMEKVGKGRVNYRISETMIEFDRQEEYFRRLDLNHEEDRVLADMASDVKEEMARIAKAANLEHILPQDR